MILPIYLFGSTILRQKTQAVDKSYPRLQELIQNMYETLEKADGVGLAAPQIGLNISLLIVDGHLLAEDRPELARFKRTIINPRIIEESGELVTYSEGCLSIPNINADIERPARIRLAYLNTDFKPVEEVFEGFACRMIQHEYSHLQGELFVDLAPAIRKKMIASKLQNIAKGKIRTAYKSKIKK